MVFAFSTKPTGTLVENGAALPPHSLCNTLRKPAVLMKRIHNQQVASTNCDSMLHMGGTTEQKQH